MILRRGAGLAALSALLLAVPFVARPADPTPSLDYEEKTLREANVSTDGRSLLVFFRARTLTEDAKAKLVDLVRALGDDKFAVRERATEELKRAGRPAVKLLQGALTDPDLEVRRRAEDCLQAIEHGPNLALIEAASRLVAARRPPGAAEVLLAYLPSAEDDSVHEAVFQALAAVGSHDGRPEPAVTAALTDREPVRRAAAAFALGRTPEHQKWLRPLLADPAPAVRFHAAVACFRGGDKSAANTLIALLTDAPLPLAWQTEELLGRAAGEQAPAISVGAGAEQERRKCRAAWEAWWKDNADAVDLVKLDLDGRPLGLTVVCDCDVPEQQKGRIWECGADGKPRWQFDDVRNPSDFQVLPGGRLLVAEFQGNRVTERDRQGKVIWEHKVSTYPTTCVRLPNGNTFIATYSELLEVTPDGKTVSSRGSPAGSIYRVQRLRNGNLLFASSGGHVVETDATGKELRRVPLDGAGIWAGVELLPNGRYLVALYGINKVVEIDANGKVHWEVAVQTPSSATRLDSGNILVASMDARAVVEFDRGGKEVRKQMTQGRPFLARRR